MNALEAEMQRQSKKALVEQVQTRKVQFIDAKISLEEATAEMRHFKFSQLAVFHVGRNVGSLSDKTITDLLLGGGGSKGRSRIRFEYGMYPLLPGVLSNETVGLSAVLLLPDTPASM